MRPHLFALLLVSLSPIAGQAQHGVDDSRVSLPEGPGSLEGVGENVGFDPNMGSMTWRVPITVTRGFPGVTPDLSLAYNSGGGSGIVGMGWSLGLPVVERMTYRGLPTYDRDDDFSGSGDQLVRVADGPDPIYRARYERSFMRWTWMDAGDGRAGWWRGEYPDGRVACFGARCDGTLVQAARVTDPLRGGVAKYHLVEMIDLFDHRMTVSYRTDGVIALPQAIEYVFIDGSPTYAVTFDYEARADQTGSADLSDAKCGFDMRLTQRLRFINVLSRGQRIRRYRLFYESYADAGGFTRLSRIDWQGQRGGVYPIGFNFEYSQALGGAGDGARPFVVEMGAIGAGMQTGSSTLVDLNSDGLPDVVRSQPGQPQQIILNTLDPDGRSARFMPAQASIAASEGFPLMVPDTQVVDLDGDGRSDLANFATGQTLRNTGAGDWAEGDAISTQGVPAFGGAALPPRFVDLDGDKNIDLVSATGTQIFMNRGTSFSAEDIEPIGFGVQQGLIFADMNGDGLLDPARVRAGAVDYRLSLGHGRWSALRTVDAPIDNADLAIVALEDINGDALADLVIVEANAVRIALNRNGSQFVFARTITRAEVDGELPVREPTTTVLYADMNGNASTDIVWIDGEDGATRYLDLFPARPNLISRLTNDVGMVTTVRYTSAAQQRAQAATEGDPWTTALAHPMIVVEAITTSDLLTNLEETDSHRYFDGFYDGAEKQFRGFRRVVTALQVQADDFHEPGQHTRTYDLGDADPYRHGLMLGEESVSGGRVLNRERREYIDCDVAEVPAEGLDLPIRYLCHTETNTQIIEGADPEDWFNTRSSYDYDGYGNVIRASMLGVVSAGEAEGACAACPADRSADPSIFGRPCGAQCLGDELFTETDFIEPGADTNGRWIISAPFRQRAFGRAGSDQVKETLTYYDGEPFVGLPLGQLDQARQTRVTQRISADSDAVIQAVRNRFDDDGNVVETLDPLGAPTGHTHRRQYTFDREKLRVVRTDVLLEDPEGEPYRLRRAYRYEPLFDQMAEATAWLRVVGDAVLSSRRSTLFAYDEFARPVSRVEPGGDSLANPTRTYTYELASPVSRIITRSRSTVGGPLDLEAIACFDGRGRGTQLRGRIEPGRYQVDGFIHYNTRSAVLRTYQPYLSASDACDAAPPAGVLFTQHTYDATGRVLDQTHSDEAIYGTASTIRRTYRPLEVVAFDAEDTDPDSPHFDTPHRTRTDGLGRPHAFARTLVNGQEPPTLTARYDELGRLRGYVDPDGNEKIQTYDLLDRLLTIDGPNSGRTELEYDAASNRIEERDARGFRVRYVFDGANRMRQRFEADDPLGTLTEWVYDRTPADCPAELCSFPEGKVVAKRWPGLTPDAPRGRDRYGFDVRDRFVARSRTIDGVEFVARTLWDNADRDVATTWPDGTTVRRRYDGTSRLRAIPGIIDLIEYGPRNQPIRMERTDGTVERWEHDDLLRVVGNEILGADGSILQGFRYALDRASNYRSVTDLAPEDGAPRADQVFTRDAWYRLTATDFGGAEQITTRYDVIDNLIERTSSLGATSAANLGTVRYGEAGVRPNAAVDVAGQAQTYDDAGYLIETDRTLEWDFLGRLIGVGDSARFAYGPGPERVQKIEGAATTLYPFPGFDVRDGISSVYVSVGRRHVARITSDALATDVLPDLNADERVDVADAVLADETDVERLLAASVRRQLFEASPRRVWFGTDHIGSLTLATAGQVLGRRGFYPGGLPRGEATGFVDEYGFSGQEHDASTGLIHYSHRYLDPRTGRWISDDPLFRAATTHTLSRLGESSAGYAYVANRPASAADEHGQILINLGGAMLGAFVAAGAEFMVQTASNGSLGDPSGLTIAQAATIGVAGVRGLVMGFIAPVVSTLGDVASGALRTGAHLGVGALERRGRTVGKYTGFAIDVFGAAVSFGVGAPTLSIPIAPRHQLWLIKLASTSLSVAGLITAGELAVGTAFSKVKRLQRPFSSLWKSNSNTRRQSTEFVTTPRVGRRRRSLRPSAFERGRRSRRARHRANARAGQLPRSRRR